MKKISFWATMLAMLVVCGLSVTSCSKDDKEETNGGGGKQQTYSLDDYVYKYWTRCERVGANLVIEMVFENISDNNIYGAKLALVNGDIKDNLGNTYSTRTFNVELASATDINSISNYTQEWQTLNIPAGRAVAYFVKIKDFDPSNRATKVSFDATFSVSSGLPATTYTINTSTLPIEDRRVMGNGIMTNDTALVYTVTNCERVGGVVQIDFTVTNDSEIELGNLTFGCAGNATDDLGNNYYTGLIGYGDIAFGAGSYKNSYVQQLKPHKTINGRLRIDNFDTTNKAKFVSVPISCESSTYTFSDDVARFITVPITDNRVLSGGIQTPDLKLGFALTNAKVDNDGDLIVNYTITNNTGDELQNVELAGVGYALDNLSNSYPSNWTYAVNGSDFSSTWWGAIVINSIANGATISSAVKIPNFNRNANNVSLNLSIKSDNYECVDGTIRFLTIPIQK